MLIEAEGIGIRFGQGPWLWRGISLGVEAGDVLAVLGPNGSGKTTCIKIMVGLIPPSEGRIRRAVSVGYVPQSTQLAFPYLVREVVAMGRARHLGLLGTLRARDHAAIATAMEEAGIDHLADKEFTILSAGQRQLALIARALASEGDVIVLDEPMASLDLRNQRRLLDLFNALTRDRHNAIIFSTHHPEHAFRAASNVLLLGQDRQPETGPTTACLSEQALSQLYGVEMRIVEIDTSNNVTRHAIPLL
jgi:iron complex transport system ATP-binding protein